MSLTQQLATRLFGGDSIFARRIAGGIIAPANKEPSLRSRIMATPIPELLLIPTGTEDSSTIKLLVAAGEQVHKYQKLAIVEVSVGACTSVSVHAPTSGVITSIGISIVADHSNQNQLCIGLASDGLDTPQQLVPVENYAQLASSEIIPQIREAGIIGMGGAGFPTAEKLNSGSESEMELLIINAAECEPYITADEALIRERADKIVIGAEILKRAAKARRCIIAIEDSKPDAIVALQLALENENNCELLLVPSKYPTGSERQLIQCVTGRELSASQLPTENGIVMQNVGTTFAVYEAFVEGKPCISRITTLCGQALKTPKNFEVLIGTPAEFLYQLCGMQANSNQQSILGGSLMGSELRSNEATICKTSNCLIVPGRNELAGVEAEHACIRCGFCADACPAKLLPQQLLAFSKVSDNTQLIEHGLLDCIECGACDYVCPSHIPLVSIYKKSKEKLQERAQKLEYSQYWQQRFQFRQYRVKKEKEQAQPKKLDTPRQSGQESKQESSPQAAETAIISKEQASRDIAAAVARVKARRDEQKK